MFHIRHGPFHSLSVLKSIITGGKQGQGASGGPQAPAAEGTFCEQSKGTAPGEGLVGTAGCCPSLPWASPAPCWSPGCQSLRAHHREFSSSLAKPFGSVSSWKRRRSGPGLMVLVGLFLPHPLRVVFPTSLPSSHTNILFPSHCSLTSFLLPQKSRLWCLTAFVEQCWDVLPARITGWSQEAELRERKQSKLEILRRSSPLTHLLLSPPNLLTFGKGESLQFACFSRFPLSPVLCRAVSGPSTMEGTSCGGRRKVNDP